MFKNGNDLTIMNISHIKCSIYLTLKRTNSPAQCIYPLQKSIVGCCFECDQQNRCAAHYF